MSTNYGHYLARHFLKATGSAMVKATGMIFMPDGRVYDLPASFHGIDYFKMITGGYELEESAILKRYFQPDQTIIEIGSNIGVVSRLAYETKLLEGGHMVCVEANPLSIPSLTSNMRRAKARMKDRSFDIIPVAVGMPDYEGQTAAFLQCNTLCSALNSVAGKRQKSDSIEVPVRSLSSIVEDHAPHGYSLICDAEGAEILILEKDAKALESCRQIAMELHHPELTGRPETPEDMVKIIENIGFVHRQALGETHYFSRPDAFVPL